MNLKDATQEWFEMEGDEVYGLVCVRPDGTFFYLNDNVIDANYFFDKVVGRMRELGLDRMDFDYSQSGIYVVCEIQLNKGGKYFLGWAEEKTEVEAGLQAAIAARKEMK